MDIYKEAHRFCTRNSKMLKGDKVCGCFYCLKIYSPTEIHEWIREQDGDKSSDKYTALCPYCGIDSVIGESAGFTLTNEFLAKMREYWFGESR